jgi:hypothetical protein
MAITAVALICAVLYGLAPGTIDPQTPKAAVSLARSEVVENVGCARETGSEQWLGGTTDLGDGKDRCGATGFRDGPRVRNLERTRRGGCVG